MPPIRLRCVGIGTGGTSLLGTQILTMCEPSSGDERRCTGGLAYEGERQRGERPNARRLSLPLKERHGHRTQCGRGGGLIAELRESR
jgi:hypothetical protein